MSLLIHNVRLAHADPSAQKQLYTVRCIDGVVRDVSSASAAASEHRTSDAGTNVLDGRGGLLLPSLCHAHIHLDKCNILPTHAPIQTGTFSEARHLTAAAKRAFPSNAAALHARGAALIRASAAAGVTAMRAHVEADAAVGRACVEAGVRLREEWAGVCDVQLCVFAQDPLFAPSFPPTLNDNAAHLAAAIATHSAHISAVGSAPYVERTHALAKANIVHVLNLAIAHRLHADFHLDYSLAPVRGIPPREEAPTGGTNAAAEVMADDGTAVDAGPPLIYALLAFLSSLGWTARNPGKVVTVGHATRLTRLAPSALRDLRERIGTLPVWFVGLPQSDLYMMGRRRSGEGGADNDDGADGDSTAGQRGTLDVPRLVVGFGLQVAMSVNNVGNAFTPQGAPDPLGLCPLGVAVYQAATGADCRVLLDAVSRGSKRAIGAVGPAELVPESGDAADFVILHANESVQSAVLNPGYDRTTVKGGRVVSWRWSESWTCVDGNAEGEGMSGEWSEAGSDGRDATDELVEAASVTDRA